jgi:hypothetical protein
LFDDFDGINYYLFLGTSLHAVVARLDSGDLIDHVHAVDYLGEHCVPVILTPLSRKLSARLMKNRDVALSTT